MGYSNKDRIGSKLVVNAAQIDDAFPKLFAIIALFIVIVCSYTMYISKFKIYSPYLFLFACIILLVGNLSSKVRIDSQSFSWLFACFILFINTIMTGMRYSSIKYTVEFSLIVLIMLLASNINYNEKRIARIIILLSTTYSIFTVIELFLPNIYWPILNFLVDSEGYTDANYWAFTDNRYVGIGRYIGVNAFLISVGLGVLLYKDKHKSILRSILTMLHIGALLLTGSRSNLIMFCGAFIIISRLNSKRKDKVVYHKSRFKRTFKILLAIVAIIITGQIFTQFSNIFSRFITGQESISIRFELYNYAIAIFKDSPIMGKGINTFLDMTSGNVLNSFAHNIIIQLLAETGIVGTFFIMVPVIMTLAVTIKCAVACKPEYKPIIATSLYVQLIFCIYGLSGNPIYDKNILFIYLLFVSMAMKFRIRKIPFNMNVDNSLD